jgi:hypothetical protein
MNPRIKQLALECGAWNQVYDQKRLLINHNFDVEKFAESIIKETLEVASAGIEYGDGMADAVFRYFGVES